MKVLIVDINQSLTESLSIMLGKMGFDSDTASNGVEALKKFMSTKFDVLLTNIVLPLMDGLSLGKEIIKNGCDAKLVFMSDTDFPREADWFFKVKKPFTFEELLGVLNQNNCGDK